MSSVLAGRECSIEDTAREPPVKLPNETFVRWHGPYRVARMSIIEYFNNDEGCSYA